LEASAYSGGGVYQTDSKILRIDIIIAQNVLLLEKEELEVVEIMYS